MSSLINLVRGLFTDPINTIIKNPLPIALGAAGAFLGGPFGAELGAGLGASEGALAGLGATVGSTVGGTAGTLLGAEAGLGIGQSLTTPQEMPALPAMPEYKPPPAPTFTMPNFESSPPEVPTWPEPIVTPAPVAAKPAYKPKKVQTILTSTKPGDLATAPLPGKKTLLGQ
jgi:hypothetical protein